MFHQFRGGLPGSCSPEIIYSFSASLAGVSGVRRRICPRNLRRLTLIKVPHGSVGVLS